MAKNEWNPCATRKWDRPLVPPRIEDSMSSGDKVRTEGSNVTLECAAHGSPKPTVTWKREDRLDITIDRNKNITGK